MDLIALNLRGAYTMKDVYEVLRQKELEVLRLQKEVKALRVVVPLLTDVEAEEYKPADNS